MCVDLIFGRGFFPLDGK